jgi:4-hydroxy-4-methyl-2-oxoglutarate aldolase
MIEAPSGKSSWRAYPPVGFVGKLFVVDSPSPKNLCIVSVIHPTSKHVGFLTKEIVKYPNKRGRRNAPKKRKDGKCAMDYSILLNRGQPDLEVIKGLSKFSVPLIGDTIGRYGCLYSVIKPLSSSMRLAGPALTVQTYRADNLMLHVALELANPGDILVVDACGFPDTGIWGDLMTQMAKKKGIGGIVVDGGVRDSQAIIESGFPVFARAISPMGGFKASPGSVNIPIACAGVSVNPGDIVVGDADGVVIVQRDSARTVLAATRKTAEHEYEIVKRIQEGETLFNILKLNDNLEYLGLSLPKERREKHAESMG